MFKQHLAIAERHVAQGQRHVARQREIVAELTNDGHDPRVAEDLLMRFEATLAFHVAHRERIIHELAAIE